MRKKWLALFLAVMIPGAALFAGTTGKIAGVVKDKETGEPLPGANVVIVGTTLGAATNVNGEFVILNVPAGTYDVKASFIGYRDVTIRNVRVHIDLTTELTFELPSEAIELGAVEVIAERPLVNKNATNEVHIRTAEDIESLPVRGYAAIASLEAGVVQSGGNLYVRGGRREEVAYYIDGVYQNNPLTLGRAGEISNNSIEEIQYQAGGMGAEYGFANSGVINVTTKTGGNQYRLGGEIISDEFLKERETLLGTYSYGYNLYNINFSGPVPGTDNKIKFYIAGERRFFRDQSPTNSTFPAMVKVGTNEIVYPMPWIWPDENGDNAPDEPIWKEHIKLVDEDNLIYRFPVATGYFPETDSAKIDTVEAQFKMLRGPKPNNESSQWHWNGNLTFDWKTLKFKLGGNSSRIVSRTYIHQFALFNGLRNRKNVTFSDAYYLKVTHTPGPNTFWTATLSYFRTGGESGDPYWWDDLLNAGDRTDYNGDGKSNPWLLKNGQDMSDPDFFARFAAPGNIINGFSKQEIGYIGIKADLTHQIGRTHELKAGIEYRYNTVRSYNINTHRLALNTVAQGLKEPGDNEFRASYTDNIGYDFWGQKKIDEGPFAAKHPVVFSVYGEDKMEFKDLVLKLGLRLDYFDPAEKRFANPANIKIVNGQIDEKQLVDPVTHLNINPRIGISFPVTDRTVFHAQYGKYTQTPELNRLFVPLVGFANDLQAGNFTISGNPELKPVKTTSYEIGFRQQIGDNMALEITAYFKEQRDLVQVRNLFPEEGAQHGVYARYVNGDYGTVKGLSLSFDLRRTNRVAARASYTLQYAGATGSNATSGFAAAWLGTQTITFVSPTDFDQRHTGTVNIDFRTRPDDGPEFLGGHPFGRLGLNLLFTFGSGLAYTPIEVRSFIFGGTLRPIPRAAVNSAYMPWQYSLDMRIDKRFEIGNMDLNAYIWIINLFNNENIQNVFPATGNPDDDGWLRTLEGRSYQKEQPHAAKYYLPRIVSPFNWGAPRQIRFGLRFDIKAL